MTTSNPKARSAPETTAADRVRKYVERRSLMAGLDPDTVHAIDTGCPSEAELTLSDLRALLADVEGYTLVLGPLMPCGRFAALHGAVKWGRVGAWAGKQYVPCFDRDGNPVAHPISDEYLTWRLAL